MARPYDRTADHHLYQRVTMRTARIPLGTLLDASRRWICMVCSEIGSWVLNRPRAAVFFSEALCSDRWLLISTAVR